MNLLVGKKVICKKEKRLKNLENIIKRYDLTDSDKQIVKELYNDLKDALGGFKNDK